MSYPIPPTGMPAGDRVAELVQKITWLRSTHPYGHTAIKIQTDELVIYLDPVDLVKQQELPPGDIILITHDHADHFSPRTVAALSKDGTTVVSTPKICSMLGEMDTVALAPGEKVRVDGLEIEGIPAYNASHAQASGGLGFILTINDVRLYCSGDTGLNPEIESLAAIDIAVLNVRNPYALSGAEVVEFAGVVKPRVIIPIHWMPEDSTYCDAEEIRYIQQNIPGTTRFLVLELEPPGQ